MAELRDERGNPIYLTDEHGKPAQLVDEYGNAMLLKGVAATVPHLKESSYTGPHPITAPITTTDTPYHAQPIFVSHEPLQDKLKSSSNSTEDHGEGKGRITNKPEIGVNEPSTASVIGSGSAHEKKGIFTKIKEKLSGHHNDP